MSDLRMWSGTEEGGRSIVVVAKDAADAARRVGVPRANFPFRFHPSTGPLPYGVGRPGVYRPVGGAWVRDEPAKGPPDLEEP